LAWRNDTGLFLLGRMGKIGKLEKLGKRLGFDLQSVNLLQTLDPKSILNEWRDSQLKKAGSQFLLRDRLVKTSLPLLDVKETCHAAACRLVLSPAGVSVGAAGYRNPVSQVSGVCHEYLPCQPPR
jgi:hypothetical protein